MVMHKGDMLDNYWAMGLGAITETWGVPRRRISVDDH